jgi:hypothetical protein
MRKCHCIARAERGAGITIELHAHNATTADDVLNPRRIKEQASNFDPSVQVGLARTG